MSSQSIGFGGAQMDSMDKGKTAIEQFFNPEFRNRLDEIITFNSLDPLIMEKIVDKLIAELNGQMVSRHISLSLSDDARKWLANKGYDPRYGARPLARIIQRHIKDKLSDEILFGKLEKGGVVRVNITDNEPAFHFD